MNENDVQAIPDNELDEVSGGTNAKDIAAQAAADGRTIALPKGNYFKGFCICAIHNKWARSTFLGKNGALYYIDIKCYKCGQTWDGHTFDLWNK